MCVTQEHARARGRPAVAGKMGDALRDPLLTPVALKRDVRRHRSSYLMCSPVSHLSRQLRVHVRPAKRMTKKDVRSCACECAVNSGTNYPNTFVSD